MEFSEKLKIAREKAGLTQAELAKISGVSARTLQNYELGASKPHRFETVEKLSDALGMTPNDLMNNSDVLVVSAYEKGGSKAARDVNELVSDLTGLFAGGELDDAEKDAVMAALSEAYWKAKEKNKKYTPNKYKKKPDNR